MKLDRKTEILTRLDVGYGSLLTAVAMNPMPDQEDNFLPTELCLDLHFILDLLEKARNQAFALFEEEV